jgi:hypothetical protein
MGNWEGDDEDPAFTIALLLYFSFVFFDAYLPTLTCGCHRYCYFNPLVHPLDPLSTESRESEDSKHEYHIHNFETLPLLHEQQMVIKSPFCPPLSLPWYHAFWLGFLDPLFNFLAKEKRENCPQGSNDMQKRWSTRLEVKYGMFSSFAKR